MEYIEEKDLIGLPPALQSLTCPNCEHFSYEHDRVLGMTKPEFAYNPDPCQQWKEKYQCPNCETTYVITNGT
jgi:hypothetical protein